jgi:parallel beta-helix repeat protein
MVILGRGSAPAATVSASRRRSAPSSPPEPDLPRPAAKTAVASRPAAGSASSCAVTSTEDSGQGSFRACLESIAQGGSIRFSPAVFPPDRPATIRVRQPLPAIVSGGVTIDASDAGVILDGSQTGPEDAGITIGSDGNVIKGLQITGFGVGISIGQAGHNLIGGDRARGVGPSGEGNVLNGLSFAVVHMSGERSSDNVIRGNLIGMDAAGRPVVSPANGIVIGNGAHDNFVGGAAPSERNIINGYGYSAVSLQGHSDVAAGNYIGTDITGMRSLGGLQFGINVTGSNNRVGGSRPEERNLVSGVSGCGIFVGFSTGTGNLIVGNWVGLDATGENGLPGGTTGIGLGFGAWGNRVEGNVVEGGGIGLDDWGTSFNSVVGNRVAMNAAGTRAIPGGGIGNSNGAAYNRIGGTRPEDRNIIALGMTIGFLRTPNTLVLGNYIGTDASGEHGLNGDSPGLMVRNGAGRQFIGGATRAEGNLISGNRDGVVLQPGADRVFIGANVIRGNGQMAVHIGHAEKSMLQANRVTGNLQAGIVVADSLHNTLRRNRISGHTGPAGIRLLSGGNGELRAPVIASATGNTVSGTACAGCTVEIFSDADDEGGSFQGSVVAAQNGSFLFTASLPIRGPNVTATATDTDGSTSGFSAPVRLLRP